MGDLSISLGITQAIFDLVVDEANALNAERVIGARIRLGMNSHVQPESVRRVFRVLSRNTVAEDAHLRFERTKPTARCLRCNTVMTLPTLHDDDERWVVVPRYQRCECCGGTQFELDGGDECVLEMIEIERMRE